MVSKRGFGERGYLFRGVRYGKQARILGRGGIVLGGCYGKWGFEGADLVKISFFGFYLGLTSERVLTGDILSAT